MVTRREIPVLSYIEFQLFSYFTELSVTVSLTRLIQLLNDKSDDHAQSKEASQFLGTTHKIIKMCNPRSHLLNSLYSVCLVFHPSLPYDVYKICFYGPTFSSD
jgi:hypothetical protein